MILQWIWEQPQTLIGWILSRFILHGRYEYKDRVIIRTRKSFGVSLGRYIIISIYHTVVTEMHEYGHCRQSRMLGPLYLIVVGIPSIIRAGISLILWKRGWSAKRNQEWYYGGYPENWANKLGGVSGKS